MDKKLKIGVIGAGRIGAIHIQNVMNFVPEAEVKAVVDKFPEKVKEWAAKLNISKISDNCKDIL